MGIRKGRTLGEGRAWEPRGPGSPLASRALSTTIHATGIKIALVHGSVNSAPRHCECLVSRRLCVSPSLSQLGWRGLALEIGAPAICTTGCTNPPTRGPARRPPLWSKTCLQGEHWERFPTLGKGVKNGHRRLVRFKVNVGLTCGCSCWNRLPDGVVLFR